MARGHAEGKTGSGMCVGGRIRQEAPKENTVHAVRCLGGFFERMGLRERAQMAGGDGGARRLFIGLATETNRPTGAVKHDDQIATGMLDGGDFVPGDTQIHGSAELQPVAGEKQVAYLVRPAAAEANRGLEMTVVAAGEDFACLKGHRHRTRAVLDLGTGSGLDGRQPG